MVKKKVQKINLEDELKEWESATIQDLSEYDKWNLTVAKHNTTIKNTGNACLYAPEEAAFKSKTDWSKLRSMKDEDIAYDEDNPIYNEQSWRNAMAAPDVPDNDGISLQASIGPKGTSAVKTDVNEDALEHYELTKEEYEQFKQGKGLPKELRGLWTLPKNEELPFSGTSCIVDKSNYSETIYKLFGEKDVKYDPVERPKHYLKHPSGVECINITEHYDFCVGNAIKYLWRAGIKSKNPLEDLKKAKWYIERKIKQLDKG